MDLSQERTAFVRSIRCLGREWGESSLKVGFRKLRPHIVAKLSKLRVMGFT